MKKLSVNKNNQPSAI